MSKLTVGVRTACFILGLTPDQLDAATVEKAWGQETRLVHLDATAKGTEPDLERLRFIDQAKQTLLEWVREPYFEEESHEGPEEK